MRRSMGQVAVAYELRSLRAGYGITLEKLSSRSELLRLPAVTDNGASGTPEERAFRLLECVLVTDATYVAPRVGRFVSVEINLVDGGPTKYEDRKQQLIQELSIFGAYDTYARTAYEKVASVLLQLSQSPCTDSLALDRERARARQLQGAREEALGVAMARLLGLFLRAKDKQEIDEISKRILELLPDASELAIELRPELRNDSGELVLFILRRTIRQEYGEHLRSPVAKSSPAGGMVLTPQQIDVLVGRAGGRLGAYEGLPWEVEPTVSFLGSIVLTLESEGKWVRVLAPNKFGQMEAEA